MELQNRVVVITGGSGGIGQAMARRFLADGAASVTLADLDEETVGHAASAIGCEAEACDVTNEDQIVDLVDKVLARHGRIDLFCSNAGATAGGEQAVQSIQLIHSSSCTGGEEEATIGEVLSSD